MNRSLRSLAARFGAPALAALDRRLEQLAARLELHTMNLANEQRRRLDAIDERVSLGLRLVDEHLLAMERLTASLPDRDAMRVVAAALDAGTPSLLLVVPPGCEPSPPDGFRVAPGEPLAEAPEGAHADGPARGARVLRLEPLHRSDQ
ncbi:MAG TPA: hypothetical protein VF183_11340 [Acidimicrobiales bacterium]